VGFSAFLWNIKATLYHARMIKSRSNAHIVIGGPEVTPDNTLINDDAVDLFVFGPGEPFIADFLTSSEPWKRRWQWARPGIEFEKSPTPYATIPLEHTIGNMMLLETTRGCPYCCADCFYSKAVNKPIFKDEGQILAAVQWALEHHLFDPGLARG
jgi:radical SAM superfamily enzyme YgiQ (UPF0313 family)